LSRVDSGRDSVQLLARFDFANHVEPGGKLGQIRGSHRIAVPRGSRKWRKITIRRHRLREDAAGSDQQLYKFRVARGEVAASNPCGLFLDMASVFKAQDTRIHGRGEHGKMIRQEKTGSASSQA